MKKIIKEFIKALLLKHSAIYRVYYLEGQLNFPITERDNQTIRQVLEKVKKKEFKIAESRRSIATELIASRVNLIGGKK